VYSPLGFKNYYGAHLGVLRSGEWPESFRAVELNSSWPRNRRFCAVVTLLLGAIIGSWLSRTACGIAAPFWFAAGVKLSITVAWIVASRENRCIEALARGNDVC
jgi:hypothetical protein